MLIAVRKGNPPKFAVDCMLGKLAKWLRILGFDTVYFSRINDDELLALAGQDNRILLTRDYRLSLKAAPKCQLFIKSDSWQEQLIQVMEELDLKNMINPYSRCLECNTPLKAILREAVKQLVPAYVYEQAKEFSICPKCSRVYWRGTHFQDMDSKIISLLSSNKNREEVRENKLQLKQPPEATRKKSTRRIPERKE